MFRLSVLYEPRSGPITWLPQDDTFTDECNTLEVSSSESFTSKVRHMQIDTIINVAYNVCNITRSVHSLHIITFTHHPL